MFSVFDRFGRVTIPAEIRKSLGLKPGMRFMFYVKNNELMARPIKKDLTLDEIRDILAEGFSSSEDFMKRKREEKALEYGEMS